MTESSTDAPRSAPLSGPAREPHEEFTLELRLQDNYTQIVDFGLDGVAPLVTDEPPPLGTQRGPNPARLLGSAVGSCLGASLMFCLRKARVEVTDLRVSVSGTLARNERGRLRISALRVRLAPTVAGADRPRLGRCLELFEDFCVVTESVREGVEVQVEVEPGGSPSARASGDSVAAVPTQ